MKKLMITLLYTTMLLVGIITPLHCNHIHTNDSGSNGINCTHSFRRDGI